MTVFKAFHHLSWFGPKSKALCTPCGPAMAQFNGKKLAEVFLSAASFLDLHSCMAGIIRDRTFTPLLNL